MRTKNAMFNMITTLLKQLFVALSGLILHRMVMEYYGSEVNGLIGSVTQFLSYIALMEAGVGDVIKASLYKPLYDRDMAGISGILKAAKQFFHKIGFFSCLYILALCVLYPMTVTSSFETKFVVSMILILSIGTLARYFISLPYVMLISASQKIWVFSAISILTTVLTMIASCTMIYMGADVRLVKTAAAGIYLLNPLLVTLYVHRTYVFPDVPAEESTIKQRWNGLSHHVASFVHLNVDVALITLLMDLRFVSVYMVYRSVYEIIQNAILSISHGCSAAFGDLIAEGNSEKINQNFDRVEFIQSSITTVLYSVTFVMIVPFVRIYTKDILDADYIQPVFASVIILAQAIYCIRMLYSTVILSANRFKETQSHAWTEAGINVFLSLLLIRPFGLAGIAVGTLTAMLVRYILDIRYLSQKLLNRPIIKSVKSIFLNLTIAVLSVLIVTAFHFHPETWLQWIGAAVFSSAVTGMIAFLGYRLFYKEQLNDLLSIFTRLFLRKNRKTDIPF